MMLLKSKSNDGCHAQDNKNNYPRNNQVAFNCCFFVELVQVSKVFPILADDVGGHTAIATGQIAWSNQSLADEATFGKMLSLALVSHKSSVSRGGWSSPGSENPSFSFERKRVFCVDATNRTPVQTDGSENVVDYNFRIRNSNAGIPKNQPGTVTKPDVYPNFCEKQRQWLGGKGHDSGCGESNSQNRYNFARTRTQQLGIHTSSLTQLNLKGRVGK
jgi:hypothetical protein